MYHTPIESEMRKVTKLHQMIDGVIGMIKVEYANKTFPGNTVQYMRCRMSAFM